MTLETPSRLRDSGNGRTVRNILEVASFHVAVVVNVLKSSSMPPWFYDITTIVRIIIILRIIIIINIIIIILIIIIIVITVIYFLLLSSWLLLSLMMVMPHGLNVWENLPLSWNMFRTYNRG